MQQYLKIVGNGQRTMRDFTAEEAEAAMSQVVSGEASDAQTAALMAVLRIKEESSVELTTFTQVMRGASQRLETSPANTLDVCVPYDGRTRTPIFLLAAAILAAACGAHIALHGRVGQNTPPKFGIGVGDLLEALHIPVTLELPDAGSLLSSHHLAFAAPAQFAPILESFMYIRADYGMRSFFNTVEKLLNPFNASSAIVGIFHYPVMRRVAESMHQLGYARGAAVQGPEGSVEALTSRRTPIIEFKSASTTADLQESSIDPNQFTGWYEASPENTAYTVGDMADLTLRLIDSKAQATTYERNSTLLSAGLLLNTAGIATSIPEGVTQARGALISGAAQDVLHSLQGEARHA